MVHVTKDRDLDSWFKLDNSSMQVVALTRSLRNVSRILHRPSGVVHVVDR
jgi:hypothetical protein